MQFRTEGNLNILLISVMFPPLNLIGSTRPYTWAKYLGKDHNITVLTPKKTLNHGSLNYSVNDGMYNVIEYGGIFYHILNRTSTLSKVFVKCHYILWCVYVIFTSIKNQKKYDILITTYSTWHCHFLGYSLKRLKICKKWLADYRDLWNNNSHRVYKFKVFKKFSTFFEKRFLKHVDAVTSVSKPLLEDLKDHLQVENASFQCIYNGFERRKRSTPRKKAAPIVFTHTGMIYPKYRDPSLFFQAIQNLMRKTDFDRSGISIRFVGDMTGNVLELAKKYSVEDMIELTGQVDREKSLDHQIDSNFLLLLNPGGDDSTGIMTGKVFEYISSGVPILGIGFSEKNVAGKIITKTKTGMTFTDVKKLEDVLNIYVQRKEISWFKPDYKIIDRFRSEKQVEYLQNLLYSITN